MPSLHDDNLSGFCQNFPTNLSQLRYKLKWFRPRKKIMKIPSCDWNTPFLQRNWYLMPMFHQPWSFQDLFCPPPLVGHMERGTLSSSFTRTSSRSRPRPRLSNGLERHSLDLTWLRGWHLLLVFGRCSSSSGHAIRRNHVRSRECRRAMTPTQNPGLVGNQTSLGPF